MTRGEERGVTLLDVVVGTALMLLVFVGIASVFQLSIDVITNNRARAGAIALLNERMEYLRSLSYGQIGVIGGIPAGNVPQEEAVMLGDISYTRRTMVLYSDDAGDGLGGADANGIIADYKTIRVEVGWTAQEGERSITLVGRVSPFGIETAVPGGILTINVVNETAVPVSNAQVDIVSTSVVPAINIRTYTNVDGLVSFIGAPAATDYQITVSKSSYSTAQTYPVTVENPNPNPRHLTVVDNQTTSASFTIDYVSEKTVETYMAVRDGSWSDTMADGSLIATMSSSTVGGGEAKLSGGPGSYPSPGFLQSTTIAPSLLYRWTTFTATTSVPADTDILFRFYDGAGTTLISDSELPGNASGFSASDVDLSGISTTTYPQLRIDTTFTSDDPLVTPSIDEYAVFYEYGPELLPNLSFAMRGEKTIGNNPTVYKYDEEHSSGAASTITLSDVEADTYTLSISTGGYMLAESCEPQPEVLVPASMQTTRLYVLPETAHSLLVDVRSNAGVLLEGASVQLTKIGYDETRSTASCGQVFFRALAADTYTAVITLTGYQPYTTNVDVNGASRLSVALNPQ